MNERIKELAEQAGEYAMSLLGTETYPEGFAAGIHFTELLIKDMIIVVRKHQDIVIVQKEQLRNISELTDV